MNDLKNWLRLHHAKGIGNITAVRLFEHFSGLGFLNNPHILSSLTLKVQQRDALMKPDHAAIEKDCLWQQIQGQNIITWSDDRYPGLLREMSDPPIVLFVRGDVQLLSQVGCAVVGSRNPTTTGRELAFNFAKALSRYFVVTSGLALGIDGASHRGALAASGKTIAVMGTGLDVVYPKSHAGLAAEIAQSGALVSEFSPHVGPKANHFPRRNRIISGLSIGTLVVEAALRSGSLITAKQALDQGREVFAIPGSIHNPLSRGCHHLIRQGAKLVESVDDILEELPALLGAAGEAEQAHDFPGSLSQEHQSLLSKMDFDPISINQLVNRLCLPLNAVSCMLLHLELEGYVRLEAGGYQKVVR